MLLEIFLNPQGTGILYGLCGEVYVGSFECGKRSGCGKQTYRDWMDEKESYHVYNGKWANDKRDGVGTLTFGKLGLVADSL
jgi:hypothetical protein